MIAAIAIVSIPAYVYLEKRAAEPVSDAEAESIVEQNQLNTQLLQEALNEDIAAARAEAQERLDSPQGQALFAKCLEWQEFHANHPSENSATNRDEACEAYEAFLSGQSP